MGIPVPSNAPAATFRGREIAVAGFITPLGTFMVALAERQNAEWVIRETIWGPGSDMLTPIQNAGGIVAFNAWIAQRANEALARQFIAPAPTFTAGPGTTVEPTTQAEVPAAVLAGITGGAINLPVPEIPAALRADYDAYWTAAVPVGNSVIWANGSITKLGAALALYADPGGRFFALAPNSDLVAIARASATIAAKWKLDYGFDAA